mmetsp:Transcript_85130/g.155132  ORF Transcript_85130/g.155132 Transcript_85130/m.155132 type:complete len:699 (-) Transcript_85130:51-2147(-)
MVPLPRLSVLAALLSLAVGDNLRAALARRPLAVRLGLDEEPTSLLEALANSGLGMNSSIVGSFWKPDAHNSADGTSLASQIYRYVWGNLSLFAKHLRHEAAMPFFFGLGTAALFICAIIDFRTSSRADPASPALAAPPASTPAALGQSATQSEGQAASQPVDSCEAQGLPERSVFVVVMLTSYRFYTGFLGATWVPFLIAKEGDLLIADHKSVFMGIEKLIYGFSILLNPFFGLLSDRLAGSSHWGGRSSFLLVGVGIAGIGIYAAKIASEAHDISWYLGASLLWMLGEAMADITTETVAPEMLPSSQYDLAATIRTLHHVSGAAFGYIFLLIAAAVDWHFHWLYITYLLMMLLCAFPCLIFMREARPANREPRSTGRSRTGPCMSALFEAYVAPMRYAGGFPRACVCMCVFSLGTSPIFFTLLMLHDLVGISDQRELQQYFSKVSIVFLMMAGVTAAFAGLQGSDPATESTADTSAGDADRPRQDASSDSDLSQEETTADSRATTSAVTGGAARGRAEGDLARKPAPGGDAGAGPPTQQEQAAGQAASSNRWPMMMVSIAGFGVVCAAIPAVSIPAKQHERLSLFVLIAGSLGLTFGSVYSRFQACTWSLLPRNVDYGNAMGIAAMAKVVGCGVGNFIAGVILDCFRQSKDNYNVEGYFVMSWASAFAVILSAIILSGINRKKRVWSCCGKRIFCLC